MKKQTLFLILLLSLNFIKAQNVQNYYFSHSIGSYVETSASATLLSSVRADDAISNAQNIGFSFVYDGSTYTQFKMSSNGFISFGTGSNSRISNNFTSAVYSSSRPFIAPLWDNLSGTSTNSVAAYEVTGSAPNRVLTVEWRNWFWDENAIPNPTISFQVKLYETTNMVEFLYRQENGSVSTASLGASIGIGSSNSTSFLNLTSVSNPAVSNSTHVIDITTKPLTGQIFSFRPCAAPILAPTISSTAPTCSSAGTSTISNYSASNTYSFNPATSGITIDASGLISGLTEGTSYTVISTNGGCSSLPSIAFSNSVSVPILAPTANGIQVFCNTALPTVANLTATGTNIQWYVTSTGGLPIASTEPLADETYYATQIVNGCESTSRTAVSVRFNDPQITASETTVCSGTQVSLTASTTALINNSGLPTNLQNGLVGYWPFNGNANDESGNGNNGTVNGATLTDDRFGNANSAYSFDGVNDNIIILNNSTIGSNITNQLTISVWCKINDFPFNFAPMVSKNGTNYHQYEFFIEPDLIGFWSTNIYSTVDSNNFPNIWNNYIVSFDNGTIKYYKNGVLINTFTVLQTSTQSSSSSNLEFGMDSSSFTEYLYGLLDDIAIYNRALSPAEISQLYSPNQITYLWSTGETTATINPAPTETTTYWCDVTVNGSTCRKEVTITVNPLNTYYADSDGDGFGSGSPVLLCSPTPPTGYATNNSDCNDGLSTFTTSCVVTLPLKVLIQGYYKGSGQMTPVRKNAGLSSSNDEVDEVTVALYSPSNVNQAVATTTVVLATNGTTTAEFDATLFTESQYYIALKHKNTIKTWSAIPVAITNYTTYDFTTAASQAYDNNQIEVAPGIYAIYSGDMNQDGNINEADLPIFTTANTTAAHGYVVSDLNGDGSVDLLDYPIYKNNAAASVNEVHPISSTNLHYVGELFGGGIVVSVWDSDGVQHGLIASLTDLGTAPWITQAFYNTEIGPTAQSDSNGRYNTNAIVALAGAGTNYAAGLCKAYIAGGYTDWYLPSISELAECFESYQIINEILGDTNGYREGNYWSSSEASWGTGTGDAQCWLFFADAIDSLPKWSAKIVRAVRRF